MEDQLDNRLQALDNMDADDIEKMRQRRLQQMKLAAAQKQEWAKRGHGEYREIFGEKEFFAEMKGEERMVCHFFRENWPCKVSEYRKTRVKCISYRCECPDSGLLLLTAVHPLLSAGDGQALANPGTAAS